MGGWVGDWVAGDAWQRSRHIKVCVSYCCVISAAHGCRGDMLLAPDITHSTRLAVAAF